MMNVWRIERAAERFNAGDRQAFGDIFDELSDDVFRFVAYRSEDPTAREEVVSDAFFRLLRADRLPEEAPALRRYAFVTARNCLIDRFRSEKPHEDLEESDGLGKTRYETDPGKIADDRSALEDVMRHLDGIDPEMREILTLRIWDDLPYSDISAITGKSVDNCKKIVSRLLEGLRANVRYLIAFFLLIP